MMRAFTGPSKLGTIQQSKWIIKRMMEYPEAEVWLSGCAFHVDTLAARLAMTLDRQLTLFVPAAPHNELLVASLIGQPRVAVIRCARGATDAESYRLRNEAMLQAADHLVAFVKAPTGYYRSGEWMTINIAKEHGILTSIETIPGRI